MTVAANNCDAQVETYLEEAAKTIDLAKAMIVAEKAKVGIDVEELGRLGYEMGESQRKALSILEEMGSHLMLRKRTL